MASRPRITEAEWRVMSVLWDESPRSSAQIVRALAEETGWKAATVKTLLARLVRKDVVGYVASGNQYLYSPLVERQAALREAAESMLETLGDGAAGALLTHCVRTGRLSEGELRALRETLDEQMALCR